MKGSNTISSSGTFVVSRMNHPSPALVSCLMYSLCSVSMVLVNKTLMTTYGYGYPMVLLFFQCCCSLMLLSCANVAGLIPRFDFKLSRDRVVTWIPVNIFFIAMLITGFFSLKYLSVPMVTIFKNANNILVTVGDWYFYGQRVSKWVALTLVLIIAGAVLAGLNDIQYSFEGYAWTFANCISSSGYVLYLRTAVKKIKVGRFAMVYYNSLISLPLVIFADCATSGHFFKLFRHHFYSPSSSSSSSSMGFWAAFVLSGCTGFALSLASFYCVKMTSPTTYSMVGAVNKVPLVIFGIWLFSTPFTVQLALYVTFSLGAGMCYAYAKLIEKRLNNKDGSLSTFSSPARKKYDVSRMRHRSGSYNNNI